MSSNKDRANRWMDVALGIEERNLGANGTVYAQGDLIFSYGSHFEMARVMRDKDERPSWVLVNGDRYSVTTSGHQSMMREVVRTCGLPSIIIPYSALDGAGIRRDSIEIIETRDDRWVTNHHEGDATGAHVEMDDPEGRTNVVERSRYVQNPAWHADREKPNDERDYSIHAQIVEKYEEQVPVRVPDPNRRRVRGEHSPIAEWDDLTNVWRWQTQTHFLGDSLFWARAGRHGRAKWLSSFDYQEANGGLYFLCELPRANDAWSVDQAIESLKPEPVVLADEAGIEWTRQGDIFAIPTNLTTREVKKLTPWGKGRIVKRAHYLGTNHTATNVMFGTQGRVYARGTMYHEPTGWNETPDHARRRMGDGKTWHLLVRNTVPRTPAPRARERALIR